MLATTTRCIVALAPADRLAPRDDFCKHLPTSPYALVFRVRTGLLATISVHFGEVVLAPTHRYLRDHFPPPRSTHPTATTRDKPRPVQVILGLVAACLPVLPVNRVRATCKAMFLPLCMVATPAYSRSMPPSPRILHSAGPPTFALGTNPPPCSPAMRYIPVT